MTLEIHILAWDRHKNMAGLGKKKKNMCVYGHPTNPNFC